MITEILSWLTEISLNLIDQFGYLGIAIVSFLENVFTPIPSEAVLPFAGVLVTQGRMDAYAAWASSMVGGLLGSLVFYYFGFWLGLDRMYFFVDRYGKWFFLKKEDVTQSRNWFDRFGSPSVLIGRLVPQVRSFISIPAGMTKMSLALFLILTAIGSGLWNGFLMWLGIYFGENYETFLPVLDKVDLIFVIIVFSLAAYFVWSRTTKRGSDVETEILTDNMHKVQNTNNEETQNI